MILNIPEIDHYSQSYKYYLITQTGYSSKTENQHIRKDNYNLASFVPHLVNKRISIITIHTT